MGYNVVISNSKLNSYGFRVLTSGIDISQYQRNPIMLWMHRRPFVDEKNDILPLGTITDVHVDGDNLKGTLNFDEADDFSKQIKAKWDAGTLKMVSPGLERVEESEDPIYLLPGQRRGTVTKSKLIEVSVVDIGANDDALALYSDGKLITLTAGGDNDFLKPIKTIINNPLNNNKTDMKAIALKLGLPEEATETAILEKIGALTLTAGRVADLELAAETQREQAITTEVENAITLKRVTADKKEHFISLGKKVGVEDLRTTLQLMTPAVKPTDLLHLSKDGKKLDGFKKLSDVPEAEAIRLRAEDKDTYAKLYKMEYGVEVVL